MIPFDRIAINQATTREQWSLQQAVTGYSRHGIRRIGAWRTGIDEIGLRRTRLLLRDHGMSVTSLNRAGPFTGEEGPRDVLLDDARRAVDEAAELDAECLMLFAGGLPGKSKDLEDARARFAELAERLLEFARGAAVKLALEPLHPMVAADRSCLTTLAEANDLCDRLGEGIGIVVDVYHVWWDPHLRSEIRRAGSDRLLGFHVNDWLVPTRDLVADRGMMGDGVINIPRIRTWIEDAGYSGPVEVEIFSKFDWWQRDPDEVVRACIERCQTEV